MHIGKRGDWAHTHTHSRTSERERENTGTKLKEFASKERKKNNYLRISKKIDERRKVCNGEVMCVRAASRNRMKTV